MRILIIGSKGFIGSHCVDYFKSKGFSVWQADVNPSSEANFFKIERQNSDFSSLFIEQQYDVCINASGSAHVGFSFNNPSKDFELNVINVQKILIALRNYNSDCKFINFSSAAVYGNPQSLPISENSICKPLSPYGFHKLQSELLLTEYYNFFGLHTCSLRVFSAYGPRLKKQLFWDLFQKSITSDTIILFGTGYETRDFIYIDDLIQIIELVIEYSDFQGAIYNVGSNIETTISDAAKIFLDAYRPDAKVVFNGEVKQGDPKNWLADIQSLKVKGFKPQFDLTLGLKKYAEWLRINE